MDHPLPEPDEFRGSDLMLVQVGDGPYTWHHLQRHGGIDSIATRTNVRIVEDPYVDGMLSASGVGMATGSVRVTHLALAYGKPVLFRWHQPPRGEKP